jgi:hypothetical protein
LGAKQAVEARAVLPQQQADQERLQDLQRNKAAGPGALEQPELAKVPQHGVNRQHRQARVRQRNLKAAVARLARADRDKTRWAAPLRDHPSKPVASRAKAPRY